jgi:serine protease Do
MTLRATAAPAARPHRPASNTVIRRLSVFSLLFVSLAAPSIAADPFMRRTAAVEVAESAGPAVVNITTEQISRNPSPFRRNRFDQNFDRFFSELFDQRNQRTVQSLGSGVVISPAGHILTNEHVIARASRIRITLADGREFDARVVGADATIDLAVLVAETDEPIPWLEPGSAADVMVGEPVIAIGNPFGLSNTVTTGVISATDRSIRGSEHTFHGFLQTDASINPGNSGGPLLNSEGTLIGINSAIYNGAQGIGFAIPIDIAKRVVAELIEHGEILPVTLGIEFQDLDPALREVMNLPPNIRGVLINRIDPGSPADEAGLRRGDVLSQLDGKKLQSARQLFEILETVTPNQQLALALWRDTETLKVSLRAQEIPDNVAEEMARRLLGLSLNPNPQGGYLISQVRANSPSARKGLAEGDLLLAVNGLPLTSEDVLRRAILNLRGRDRALLVVQRGKGRYHLTIPMH